MSMPDPALWREILNYLRRHHGETTRRWFEELEPLRLAGGVLEVRAQNAIQRNYLTKKCSVAFNDAAQSVTGNLIAVRFVEGAAPPPRVSDAAAAAEPPRKAEPGRPAAATLNRPHPRAAPPPRPVLEDDDDQIVLSPDYRFEHFVTGPGNRLAHATALAVADRPGENYNPLFIHGGVGLGKTHLLQAICQSILERRPEAHICYLSCDTFMNRFLESVQQGQMSGFRNRYRHVDLLLIDDIHFLANAERSQEEFFHTFNTLYQSGRQIVLSSDSPPDQIPQLEERLVSRFNWGMVSGIERPCYETRVAILKNKASLRGIEMPDPAAAHIAARLESNIRELEGAITKVHSLAELREVPITLELAREALGEEATGQPAPQLTIQNIIDAVTSFYGVKLSDLQSKRRHRSITVPRQVCMYLARKRTRYSLEEIGGYFGGRDHTTVMHASRTVEQRREAEPDFGAQIDRIDRQLAEAEG